MLLQHDKTFFKVRLNNDFSIDAVFENHECKHYDMKNDISKYKSLQSLKDNLNHFLNPKDIIKEAIHWDYMADITADWIYYNEEEIEDFDGGVEIYK